MSTAICIFNSAPMDAPRISGGRSHFGTIRPVRRHRTNTYSTLALTGLVLLAPIPLASNHPLVWMFWAVVIGLIGAAQTVFEKQRRIAPSAVEKHLLILGVLFLAVPIVQSLPFLITLTAAQIFGGPEPTPGGFSSIAPTATVLSAVRIASYLAFFFLMLRLAKNQGRGLQIARVLFLGVAAHAIWALISLRLLGDTNLFAEKNAYLGAATGTFINRNSFATFLGMGLVTGLALLPSGASSKKKRPAELVESLVGWLGICVILMALVSTQSRMGFAATAVAATVVVSNRKIAERRIGVLLLVGALFAVAMFGNGLMDRFSDLSAAGSIRAQLYSQVGGMIWARPLLGFGLDSFPLAYEMYHAPPVTAEFVWDKAHSTYLTLWSEAGLFFGSIPPLAGLYAAYKLRARSTAQNSRDPLATAGFAALVLCGLHALVDFSLEIQANTFLLLALVAIGLGQSAKSKGHS